jgi:cob(I)alamin adenosyltransferase
MIALKADNETVPEKKMKTGLIHIYTGEGKGKTTAAIGLAVRARGAGLEVMIAQLFKSKTGEKKMLEKLGIKYRQYSSSHPLFKKYSADELVYEKKKCEAFVRQAFDTARNENYDVLIIDELGPALSYGMISDSVVKELIKSKPARLELILTGRGFPVGIISMADYANDIKMISHPYNKGIGARKGIEY